MGKSKKITKDIVKSIEGLSRLEIKKDEVEFFTKQFNETLSVVEKLNKVDTKTTKATHQVTGLINVFREDKIEKERILKQKEALSGSKHIYEGCFVVEAVFK